MNRLEDLTKADRAVKDMVIRLNTIKTSLHAVEKEIQIQEVMEAQLEDNVNYLKKRNVIAIASEYKKAKIQLMITKHRLILLNNDRVNVRKSFAEAEEHLKAAQAAYDKVLKGPENNVIKGNFRKKNG